ncbi:MAG: rRNA maturation RNase YbeY [Deltaproteobacteria bacterium]|nr:rRNA maturation RNase YbeY [Deltaproteobacteria bacterium]
MVAREAGAKVAAIGKIRRMAGAALKGLGLKNRELSVLLAGNPRIRELNRAYRGMDKPTDVLSFPMDDEYMLGDIVISVDKAVEQAERFGVTLEEEFARLMVHGLLHLIGYDHVKGGRQAGKMKAKEAELLRLLREEGLV